ncbi:MAG: DUF167 domain-containing protein [Planctomycetes bacterium]|nr:DUF167 domain-containing protein [Planctomycetota bacterium]
MEDLDKLAIVEVAGKTVLPVKAVPGSSRDRIVGVLGEELKIAVSAPPEKGKANKAVAAILAKALGVPVRDVSLTSGDTSPHKEFAVAGISARQLIDRLKRI